MPKAVIPLTTLIDPDNLNLAEFLDEEELSELGSKLKKALDIDLQSRQSWEENVDCWMRLAVQYKETKTFPWPDAANIKYPLLTTAAMQFSARAYPALIPPKNPVRAKIVGKATPELNTISERVAEHMSYQVLEEMAGWEDDMDKLFMIIPIVGMAFKKTYYNGIQEQNVSELVLPKDLVVNYWAKKLGGYTRKHHILEMSGNDIYTRKARGHYLDVELGDPKSSEFTGNERTPSSMDVQMPSEDDETTPYRIIECHCHYDLDGDGYLEPYIVTFDSGSETVLRISPRFREDSIKWSDTGGINKAKVVSIESDEYFTKYGFIPNPDGSFYDLGFGLLLGPINETINTSINQILDQGTMYTTNGGFLGKGVRIKAGEYRFAPNEWKTVNTTVDDLRKAVYQLPVREPSQVLFQMLGALIEGGEKVASIAEIFVGKMPGQNTPATTTMETVKQGMAVFTAIYKRVYRSLDQEFKKLFKLNQLYLDDRVDYPVELTREDYRRIELSVLPTADPDVATDAEKLIKARAQLEFIPLGTVDPKVVTRRVLEAMRIEGIDELMNYQPPPNPEVEMQKQEMAIKQQDSQGKQALTQMKGQLEQMKGQLKAQAAQQDAMIKAMDAQMKQRHEAMMAEGKLRQTSMAAMQKVRQDGIAAAQKRRQSEEEHRQKVRQAAIEGQQKIEQQRELGKVKVEMAKKMPKKKPNASK